MVVTAAVWDAHMATGVMPANVTQWGGSAPNALISGRVDAAIPETQIDQIVNEVWSELFTDYFGVPARWAT